MKSTTLLLTSLLTVACVCAQSPNQNSPQVRIVRPFARLSYTRTGAVDWGDRVGIRSICFRIERDGHYRIARRTINDKQNIEISQGVLSGDEMSRLTTLLRDAEALKPTPGGWVQQGAERFVAEIQQDERTVRLRWIDPDRTRPFPRSVARIVNWLEDFSPREVASSLVSPTDPTLRQSQGICPSWAEPLEPQSVSLECPLQTIPKHLQKTTGVSSTSPL